MSVLLIRCIYDIYVKLPENVSFMVNLGNETSYIRCLNENGSSIFSYKEKEYGWIEGSEGMEYITVFAETTDNDSIPVRHMVSPISGLSFEGGGIVEPATYTIFEIIFDIGTKELNTEELNKYHELAVDMLRIFIEKYRYVTQDSTISIPKEKDILIFEYLTSGEAKEIEGGYGIYFKPTSIKYNYEQVLRKRRVKYPLSNRLLDRLSEELKNNAELDLYLKLLMEAKEHALLKHEYDLSIIKSQTAFETYIQNHLIQLCNFFGVYYLPRGKKKINYKEAIFNGNIREDLIKRYLKGVFKVQVAGSKEYNEWYERCYELRNEIVHQGNTRNLEEKDAELAFESVSQLINHIHAQTDKILKD